MPESTRVIQNKGLYKFTEQEKDAFILSVYLSCELVGDLNYENVKYSIPKGFLGYAQLRNFDYIVQTVPIEFQNQLLFRFQNDLGQSAVTLANVARQIVPIELSVSATTIKFPITDIAFRLDPNWRGIVRVVSDDFLNPSNIPRSTSPQGGVPSATGIPPAGLEPPARAYNNQNDGGLTDPNPFPKIKGAGLYEWSGNVCIDSVASRYACAPSVTVVNISVSEYIQPVLVDPGEPFGRYFGAEVDGSLIFPSGVGWCNYRIRKVS